jgi:hypothetical protein
MPNSDVIEMPCTLSVKMLYEQFYAPIFSAGTCMNGFAAALGTKCALSTFYYVIRTKFPTLKFPKAYKSFRSVLLQRALVSNDR